jgi:uncharacterized membrane protein YgcG
MMPFRCWIWIPALIASWLVTPSATIAATPEVNDDAGFFKPETLRRANRLIRAINSRHHKEVLIQTFQTVPKGKEEEATSKDPAMRNRFFSEWGKQNARHARVNGIFILVCRQPGRLEILVSNETRRGAFTAEDLGELTAIIRRSFRNKDFDGGILKAVQFIHDRMDANLGAPPPPTEKVQTPGLTPERQERLRDRDRLLVGEARTSFEAGKLTGLIAA